MRAQGRCAGCQETGQIGLIIQHLVSCAKWAALYRADPAAALGAAEEFARWRDEDRLDERKADLSRRVADTEARRAASVARFRVPDPLED
jgi:hypothetical protein